MHACIINGLNSLEPLLARQILLSACNYHRRIDQYVHSILDDLRLPDPFTWGCTVRYFSQQGQFKEAFNLCAQMQRQGLCQAHLMYPLVNGKVFDELAEKNVVSWNSILSGHLKSGDLLEVQWVFDQIPRKDIISWNSMISGYAKIEDMDRACVLFQQIPEKNYFLGMHSLVALLYLYAKCGSVEKAYELLHGLNKKVAVAYSAMISGFGMNGKVADAIKLLEMMVGTQSRLNLATFTGLLTACNHAGRAGRLQEACELIKSIPMQPHSRAWGTLLLACSVRNNVEFGEIAAQRCVDLEPNATAYYSLLANIHSSAGRWDDVRRLRKLWKDKKLSKLSGCS
ncbi:hypothetical protein POTOM_004494 [Populus tomentosa]|uniref:Pentatricopeptide repeat-containing protein n=1 Tax=Populus tomentosa TaxID=118781 RepID=A0A8X8AF84_POPTO|nr:hypothetical protein POTOM_004494 [Populus tomentosa]